MVSSKLQSYIKSIREGSSLEAVKKSIEVIERLNGKINAFCRTYFDEALEEAAKCDQDKATGEKGVLHGVPYGLKDLFLAKGRVTSKGSKAFKDWVAEETAPIVERTDKAGAILLGKTTTTEFGWTGSGVSELYGPTRNPWNTKLTSGGSSSGSAAAVAAGMVPFALGSDGGGSVRIPAAFCGIFAMKGSLGRIPTYPWSATEMLSHAGPMTKTVLDSIELFNILKGPDPRDHQALPDDGIEYLRHEIDLSRLRVAYAPTLFDVDLDGEVARVVDEAVKRLSEELRIKPVKMELDWQDPIKVFETLWIGGRGIVYGGGTQNQGFSKGFTKLVNNSTRYSLIDYIEAIKKRALFGNKVHGFFENFDILLLPTVPILPFEAELEKPKNRSSKSEVLDWACYAPFTYPFNFSGNPAASIPAGLSNSSLPVGLQVVGRRHHDADVLAFCRLLEERAGFFLPEPKL